MAIVIKWADEAKETFNENISYLLGGMDRKRNQEFCKTNKLYTIKDSCTP